MNKYLIGVLLVAVLAGIFIAVIIGVLMPMEEISWPILALVIVFAVVLCFLWAWFLGMWLAIL